jgi:hypothetical protein
MAKVILSNALRQEIYRKFRGESIKVFELIKSLEKEPHKGINIGNVGGILIKELKYRSYRIYFITDGHILKLGSEDELAALLIKFIRLSDKKTQQKTIIEIINILKTFGFDQL